MSGLISNTLNDTIDTYEAWDEATWPDDIDSSTESDDIELDDVIRTNGPTHTYSNKAKQLFRKFKREHKASLADFTATDFQTLNKILDQKTELLNIKRHQPIAEDKEVLATAVTPSDLYEGTNKVLINIHTPSRATIRFQIDCGAEISILCAGDFQNLANSDYKISKSLVRIKDVQGTVIEQVSPPIILDIMVAGKLMTHEFRITNGNTSLLGLDFMNKHGANVIIIDHQPMLVVGALFDKIGDKLYPRNNIITLASPALYSVEARTVKPGYNKLQLQSTLEDGSYTLEDAIIGQLSGQTLNVSNGEATVEFDYQGHTGFTLPKECAISNTILQTPEPTIPEFYVKWNTVDNATIDFDSFPPPTISDSEGETLQDIIEPTSIALPGEAVTEKWDEILAEQLHINRQYRSVLKEFIETEVPGVMSASEHDVGLLNPAWGIKHHINTGKHLPISSRAHNLNPVRAAQLRVSMEHLIGIGFARKDDSPWAQPAFLVPKRDGTIRMVFDSRRLNAITVPSKFPSMKICDILAEIALARPTIFSVIDIRSAFSNVELTEEAQLKSAVITMDALILPTRMMFGLINGPATWNRVMAKVFEKIPRDENVLHHYVNWYADDIIVYSKNEEDHMRHLKIVLKALHVAGLKIQMSKIALFQREVELLGHRLDSNGIGIIPRHIASVQKFPTPTDSKSIQRFVGLCNWSSNVIFNFSKKVAPLVKLLRKGEPFEWGESQESAMTILKADICEAARIYHINYDEPIYIAVDASDGYFGSMCYQIKTYRPEDVDALKADLTFREQFSKPGTLKTVHPVLPASGKNTPTLFNLSPVSKVLLKQTKHLENPDSEEPDELEPKRPIFTRDNYAEELENSDPITSFLSEKDCLHFILPIGYYSATFSPAMRNWTIMERECFSLCSALSQFAHLSVSVPHTYVLSDSQPVLWAIRTIKSAKGNVSKLQRWLIKLKEISFEVILTHISGKLNHAADALSRMHPISYKVTKSQTKIRQAITITSPFPVGRVVTLSDLENYIQERMDDNLDPICSRDDNPDKYVKTVTTKSEKEKQDELDMIIVERKIKAITTKLTRELAPLIENSSLITAQQVDKDCIRIRKELEKPPPKDKVKPKSQYYVHQGILMKRREPDDEADGSGRKCVPKSLWGTFLAFYHIDNHIGSKGLARQINGEFHIPGIYALALKFTTSCHLCAICKASREGKTKLTDETLRASQKGFAWSIDVLEGYPPFGLTKQVLVCIEYSTHFKMIFPLKRATGAEVKGLIEDRIINTFGPFQVLVSDGGSNLTKNAVVQQMLKFHGIKTHTSSPYSPQSHGTIERTVQDVSGMLRILYNQTKIPWHRLLTLVQLNLNTMPIPSLGMKTPMYCMTGIEIDLFDRIHERNIHDKHSISKFWIDQRKLYMDLVAKYTEEYIKTRDKKGGKTLVYPPGTFVYQKDHYQHAKPKIWPRYVGAPRLVFKEYTNVVLLKTFDGRIILAHKNNVKRCPERLSSLYAELPHYIREILGEQFTYEDFKEQVNTNVTPKFYDDLPEDVIPSITRKQQKILDAETEKDLLAQLFPPLGYTDPDSDHDLEEDDEDENPDPPPERNVTFEL